FVFVPIYSLILLIEFIMISYIVNTLILIVGLLYFFSMVYNDLKIQRDTVNIPDKVITIEPTSSLFPTIDNPTIASDGSSAVSSKKPIKLVVQTNVIPAVVESTATGMKFDTLLDFDKHLRRL